MRNLALMGLMLALVAGCGEDEVDLDPGWIEVTNEVDHDFRTVHWSVFYLTHDADSTPRDEPGLAAGETALIEVAGTFAFDEPNRIIVTLSDLSDWGTAEEFWVEQRETTEVVLTEEMQIFECEQPVSGGVCNPL